MVYLKWLALMPASFIMAIVGRLLAPILPFFVDKETHRLPDWLSWFATDDNDADGDQGHWERWPGTDPWSTYKRRVAWLLRNVCYGFDIDVLGIRLTTGKFEETRTPPTRMASRGRVSGTVAAMENTSLSSSTTSSTIVYSAGRAACARILGGSCGRLATRRHSTSVSTSTP